MAKRSRFETRLEEFRGWWLALPPDTRGRLEPRLQTLGQIAGEVLSDAGDSLGEHLWAVMLEAIKSSMMFGHELGWYLVRVKRTVPELWTLAEPFLTDELRAKVAAAEADE